MTSVASRSRQAPALPMYTQHTTIKLLRWGSAAASGANSPPDPDGQDYLCVASGKGLGHSALQGKMFHRIMIHSKNISQHWLAESA